MVQKHKGSKQQQQQANPNNKVTGSTGARGHKTDKKNQSTTGIEPMTCAAAMRRSEPLSYIDTYEDCTI